MEPEGADAHYRERLVRLPGLGTRYAPARRGRAVDRGVARLAGDAPLFFFPQSLFKLHPDNDALVAEVLAATGARLVAFEGRHPKLTRAWRARSTARSRRAASRAIASSCGRRSGTTTTSRCAPRATRCSTACDGRAATRASTRSLARCRS
jgi:hypothetical protein